MGSIFPATRERVPDRWIRGGEGESAHVHVGVRVGFAPLAPAGPHEAGVDVGESLPGVVMQRQAGVLPVALRADAQHQLPRATTIRATDLDVERPLPAWGGED